MVIEECCMLMSLDAVLCVLQNRSDMPQSENLQKGDRRRHAEPGSTSCILQILGLGHVRSVLQYIVLICIDSTRWACRCLGQMQQLSQSFLTPKGKLLQPKEVICGQVMQAMAPSFFI